MIKIDFEFEHRYGVFRDALHLPDDHTFTEQEIEQLKLNRFINWQRIVEPEKFEPTVIQEE